MENEKKDFRQLYENLVRSDWFKRAYNNKSIGECPFDIPELRESEDERIRKYLIYELKAANSVGELKFSIPQPTREECISYLERQKEQKQCEDNGTDGDIMQYIEEGEKRGIKEVISFPEKYGLQKKQKKPTLDEPDLYGDWDNDLLEEIHSWFGHLDGKYTPYTIDDIKLTARHFVEWQKQKEQKPNFDTHWENGSMVCEQKEHKPADSVSKEEYVKKFKALCDVYEIKLPNREYDIYHLCEDLHKLFGDVDAQKSAEWHPTHEQMVALTWAANGIDNDSPCAGDIKASLRSLYNDLQSKSIRPAEWSKEDESILNNIIAYKYLNVDDLEWLNELPNRFNLQPKQEWSYTDNNRFDYLLHFINESCENEATKKGLTGFINRIRSLGPQQWKPTDEQYEALRDATIKLDADDSDARFPWEGLPMLHSLLNDLFDLRKK